MAYLQIENLKKNFGKTEVLKGVDISVEKGEVLSIIGSSGNGKTTLLRCLNFLELPDEGTVTLDGTVLYDAGVMKKRIPEKELVSLRQHFGLVFQSFNLFPQYTVLENVRLPLWLREKDKKKKGLPSLDAEQTREEAERLIEQVGLLSKKDNYPCELSGGQMQRTAIARAIALKPDILCFDEPTSALDPALTKEVLGAIKKLKSDLGVTMIIVTHEMEFARSVSDKVVFLSDGEVLAQGTPQEVFDECRSEKLRQFLASSENDAEEE